MMQDFKLRPQMRDVVEDILDMKWIYETVSNCFLTQF